MSLLLVMTSLVFFVTSLEVDGTAFSEPTSDLISADGWCLPGSLLFGFSADEDSSIFSEELSEGFTGDTAVFAGKFLGSARFLGSGRVSLRLKVTGVPFLDPGVFVFERGVPLFERGVLHFGVLL